MFQQIIQFILGHEALLAAFGVAILDLIFALSQKAESNGVLHWIYVQLKGVKAPELPKA